MSAAGAAWFAHELWSIFQGLRSKNWPHTTGELTSCRVRGARRFGSNDFGFFYLEVAYSYSVEGITHRGNRVLFGADSFDNRNLQGAADKRASRYKAGASVSVHYDPRHPARAVLEPGVTVTTYVYLGLAAGFTATRVSLLIR